MAGRFYFYRKDQELANHRLNGTIFGGAGPAIGWVKLGERVLMVRDHLEGIDRSLPGLGRFPITPADFDGPVRVKSWTPDPRYTEWCVLATAEQIRVCGLELIPHDHNTGGPQRKPLIRETPNRGIPRKGVLAGSAAQ